MDPQVPKAIREREDYLVTKVNVVHRVSKVNSCLKIM
jgi:hypothetical protein